MFRNIIFILLFLLSTVSLAQQQAPGESAGPSAIETYGPKRQIATIVYMGLGGAVLGLSTLSFYGRPQDKLTNIAIGFGVGVVIGTIYMTYQAATNPQEFYRSDYKRQYRFEELSASSSEAAINHQALHSRPLSFSTSWEF